MVGGRSDTLGLRCSQGRMAPGRAQEADSFVFLRVGDAQEADSYVFLHVGERSPGPPGRPQEALGGPQEVPRRFQEADS